PELLRAKLEVSHRNQQLQAIEDDETSIPEETVEEALKVDPENVGSQKEIVALQQVLADYEKKSPNPSAEPGYKRTQDALEKVKKASAARRTKVEELLLAQQQRRLQRDLAEEKERVDRLQRLEGLLTN